jgi:hypothetical protein
MNSTAKLGRMPVLKSLLKVHRNDSLRRLTILGLLSHIFSFGFVGLIGLAVMNASRVAQIEYRRFPASVGAGPSFSVTEVMDRAEGRDLTIVRLGCSVEANMCAAPPGVRRFPGVGKAVLSPSIRKLISEKGTLSEGLRERVGGVIIGEVDPADLKDSEELIAYVGEDFVKRAQSFRGWGSEPDPARTSQEETISGSRSFAFIVALVLAALLLLAATTTVTRSVLAHFSEFASVLPLSVRTLRLRVAALWALVSGFAAGAVLVGVSELAGAGFLGGEDTLKLVWPHRGWFRLAVAGFATFGASVTLAVGFVATGNREKRPKRSAPRSLRFVSRVGLSVANLVVIGSVCSSRFFNGGTGFSALLAFGSASTGILGGMWWRPIGNRLFRSQTHPVFSLTGFSIGRIRATLAPAVASAAVMFVVIATGSVSEAVAKYELAESGKQLAKWPKNILKIQRDSVDLVKRATGAVSTAEVRIVQGYFLKDDTLVTIGIVDCQSLHVLIPKIAACRPQEFTIGSADVNSMDIAKRLAKGERFSQQFRQQDTLKTREVSFEKSLNLSERFRPELVNLFHDPWFDVLVDQRTVSNLLLEHTLSGGAYVAVENLAAEDLLRSDLWRAGAPAESILSLDSIARKVREPLDRSQRLLSWGVVGGLAVFGLLLFWSTFTQVLGPAGSFSLQPIVGNRTSDIYWSSLCSGILMPLFAGVASAITFEVLSYATGADASFPAQTIPLIFAFALVSIAVTPLAVAVSLRQANTVMA